MGTAVAQADRVMDRAYRRFGWRVVPTFTVAMWFSGYGFWLLAMVAFARLTELTGGQIRDLLGWTFLMFFTTLPVPVAHSIYACRRLRQFEREAINGEQAWRDAVAMPLTLVRADYAWFVVAVLPAALLCVGKVVGLDWQVVGILAFFGVGNALYILALGMFLLPVVLRPVLRAAAGRIKGPPPSVSGIALKKRLLFVVPGLSVAMAIVGCGVAFTPGQGTGLALTQLALATVLSAAATIPVTMLLEKAVRDPIDDLLEGTKRVRDADYSTPVPEFSSDELAELARSFNDAMEGLADRQKLARENVRLLDDVRASRTRLVAASDAGRRRVERNLHDGAQQRLVALALDLRLLQESARTLPPDEVDAALDQATEDVKEALAELRDLARGLHPSVLTTDGLAYALDQLAGRAKLPVKVSATSDRFPPAVESAAYFVAAEALANVTKYAHASQAQVVAGVTNGELTVEIDDDGVGGATIGSGTGLAGLADRVAALDGRLRIESPVGRGTKVIAQIPVDGRAAVAPSGIEVESESPW